jgi:hypothetical protein
LTALGFVEVKQGKHAKATNVMGIPSLIRQCDMDSRRGQTKIILLKWQYLSVMRGIQELSSYFTDNK